MAHRQQRVVDVRRDPHAGCATASRHHRRVVYQVELGVVSGPRRTGHWRASQPASWELEALLEQPDKLRAETTDKC